MDHQAFISYAHPNREVADIVVARLEAAGMSCWYAPRDVRDDRYAKSILSAIRQARYFIIIVSDAASASDHVRRELHLAAKYKKKILPLKLQHNELDDDLEYLLINRHWFDYAEGREQALMGLLRYLGLSEESEDEEVNSAPEESISVEQTVSVQSQSRRWSMYWLIGLLMIVGVGYWWYSDDKPVITDPKPVRPESTDVISEDNSSLIREVQKQFVRLGQSLPVDGVMSSDLRSVIEDFQQRVDVSVTGRVSAQLLTALKSVEHWPWKDLEVFKDCAECPEMVVIPAGRFLMGSPVDEPERDPYEGPQHQVNVPSFAIGKYEVTFEEYDTFAQVTGRSMPDDAGWGRGRRPVINVSWQDATAYTEWLSGQTDRQYRLPSEAEWEYAARAGTITPFSTGECIHTDQANYKGNIDYNECGADTGIFRAKTVPVDELTANPWGLHHMHGNAWEWAQDCWHVNYKGAPDDGSAWLDGAGAYCALRVLRGGGWFYGPRYLRSAARSRNYSDVAINDTGFRLARTL
ncbi:MAG: hypothetical protein Tsb002_06780 [Wenzhouxiangellaceae bacterium]